MYRASCPYSPFWLAAVALSAILACGCGGRTAYSVKPESGAPAAVVAATAPTPAPQPEPPLLTVTQARETLVKATQADQNDPQPKVELALFDAKTNAIREAEQGLIACWKRFPHASRAPYHLGLLYLAQGRDGDAARCLTTAAALNPDDAELQWNAGLACLRNSDEALAISYLNKAVALDPQSAEPYILLARCYDHHGTASRSLAYLRRYLELAANPAPGYYLMGRIYAQQADRDNAAKWLEQAVQSDPNNPEYLTTLGRVYYELFNATRASEGMTCYNRALAADPNNGIAHQYLGHALLEQQRFAEAIPHLRAALQNVADTGPVYYDLGQALVKSGQMEEGRRVLATYQSYRDYTDGVTKLTSAIHAAPKDRARRYALIRFCLAHHQPTAAKAILTDAVSRLGTDSTFARLQTEAEAMQAAAPPAPSPNVPAPSVPPSPSSGATSFPVPMPDEKTASKEGGPHGF